MKLNLRRTERSFRTSDDGTAILTIHEPSEAHGGWPGTTKRIRVWVYAPKGQARFDPCPDDRAIEFERELGEIKKVVFDNHPTIGRVVIG